MMNVYSLQNLNQDVQVLLKGSGSDIKLMHKKITAPLKLERLLSGVKSILLVFHSCIGNGRKIWLWILRIGIFIRHRIYFAIDRS